MRSLSALFVLVIALAPMLARAAEPLRPPAPPGADEAPIALLVDLSSGQTLFAREEDRRFMPASITKAMTAYVAFERMARGQLFPQQITAMQPATYRRWARVGSTMYLAENAPVTIDALLRGVTTVSANDGAVVLAEAALGSLPAWVAEMNRTARTIGMRDSHFGTPNGWMDEGHTFVTARDLAVLAAAMIHRYPAYYRTYIGAQGFAYNGIAQRNRDPLIGVVPGADGIKTGYTNQAGFGFLGSAQRGGRRLVMIVAGSPTGRQRNTAARALMEWGFTGFDSRILFPIDVPLGQARVQGGGLREVDLVAPRPMRLAMPRGAAPQVTLKLRYDGPLRAPIRQGQEVAELQIFLDGRQVSTLPLVARTSISSASLLQRMFNGIAGWMPWN